MGDNARRKAELSFLYKTYLIVLYDIFTKYHQIIPKIIPKGIWVTEQTQNQFQKQTKGDNSKSKKARVVIRDCHTSTHPVLHFYQVS